MVSGTVRNFGKIHDAVEILDLVAIQGKSYDRFLQKDIAPTKRGNFGLEGLFREIFPIENYDKSMVLDYLYYELEEPRYTTKQCRQLLRTMIRAWFWIISTMNWKNLATRPSNAANCV
jgi:DNA-directed RNA polymerase subunit beta